MVTPLGADVATTWTRLTNGEWFVIASSQFPFHIN
jgi:hypothetical protein